MVAVGVHALNTIYTYLMKLTKHPFTKTKLWLFKNVIKDLFKGLKIVFVCIFMYKNEISNKWKWFEVVK